MFYPFKILLHIFTIVGICFKIRMNLFLRYLFISAEFSAIVNKNAFEIQQHDSLLLK